MGYLKSVGTCFVYIVFFLGIITFIPGLPPEAEFHEYSIEQPAKLEGKLGLNNRLNNAQLLHEGELKGAEAFDSYNGELYTGVHGGYVIKIDEHKIVPIVKFGKDCKGVWQEEKCGRPLGLKFDKKGNLYVVDTYYGIFKVNVRTKQSEKVIDITQPIEGKVPKIPNTVDIASNGDIYWTDSSTEFPLSELSFTFLANPCGRLIRYNAATGKNEVLMKNLGFANGVKLSDDESFVIVLESLTARIMKYNLKGPKTGQEEIFYQGLPGAPDNVHSDNNGGFLVSLVNYIDEEHPALYGSLIPHPYIRKMLARLLVLIQLPFKLIQEVYPNEYAERLKHSIPSIEPLAMIMNADKVTVLRFNAKGEIIDAAYAHDGRISAISSAFVHNDYLWLGSPYEPYIARVPLKQAFPELSKKEVPLNVKTAQPKKIEEVKEVPPNSEKSESTTKTTVRSTTTTTPPTTTPPTTTPPTTTPPTTTPPTTTSRTTTPTTTTPPTTTPPTTTPPTTTPPTTTPPTTTPPTTTPRPTTPPTTTTPKPETQKATESPKPLPSTTPAPKMVTTTTEKPVTSTTPKPSTTTEKTDTIKSNVENDKKDAQDSKLHTSKINAAGASIKSSENLKSTTTDTKKDENIQKSTNTNKNDKQSSEPTKQ